MSARFLDLVTVVVHYLIMGYIVFGGFLVWRWGWTAVPHALMIAWAAFSLVVPVVCPLTSLEDYFRARAGLPALDGGFIAHYITGVLYPANYEFLVQVLAGMVVLVSWTGAYVIWRHRGEHGFRAIDGAKLT
ncbi:MAG: DUF2784 domain-containing protein [Sciscionella sp.]